MITEFTFIFDTSKTFLSSDNENLVTESSVTCSHLKGTVLKGSGLTPTEIFKVSPDDYLDRIRLDNY